MSIPAECRPSSASITSSPTRRSTPRRPPAPPDPGEFMQPLTRRQLLKGTGITLLGTAFVPRGLAQTAPGDAEGDEASAASAATIDSPLNRYSRAVQECYVERARAVEREANRRRAALQTKADAQRYVAEVRERFQRVFGPF